MTLVCPSASNRVAPNRVAPTRLERAQLDRAKWAFATRRVRRDDAVHLSDHLEQAGSGDLVLGRIEKIGSHKRIQLAEGRPSSLYVGDLVVLACGARYAPDQFEGLAEIDKSGADMLAGGGVLGRMRHRHDRISSPTRVVPLGLLGSADGRVINLADYALPDSASTGPIGGRPIPVIAVVGASMNSGKTTAVASFAHGLSRAGHRVAAIKATGTGAFGDFNAFVDAGAHFVADFTDAGMVSTYRQPIERIEAGLDRLLAHGVSAGCDVAVVELADGVFQKETAELIKAPRVRQRLTGLVFAAPDALATAGGCAALRAMDIEPAFVTGMVSCSPLGAAEAETATGVEIVSRAALCDPARANSLLSRAVAGRARGASTGRAAELGLGVAA